MSKLRMNNIRIAVPTMYHPRKTPEKNKCMTVYSDIWSHFCKPTEVNASILIIFLYQSRKYIKLNSIVFLSCNRNKDKVMFTIRNDFALMFAPFDDNQSMIIQLYLLIDALFQNAIGLLLGFVKQINLSNNLRNNKIKCSYVSQSIFSASSSFVKPNFQGRNLAQHQRNQLYSALHESYMRLY